MESGIGRHKRTSDRLASEALGQCRPALNSAVPVTLPAPPIPPLGHIGQASSGGAADPRVAEPVQGWAQRRDVAVVDPTGLEPGGQPLNCLDEFRQRGRRCWLRWRWGRWRRRGPGRVARREVVEHRRDVVPDLAVELATAPTTPEPDQQIPGQPRRTSHSGDGRLVPFLLRRDVGRPRLRCSRDVDHPDFNGRLTGAAACHCGEVSAPARAPHRTPSAPAIRHRCAALRAPARLLPCHP